MTQPNLSLSSPTISLLQLLKDWQNARLLKKKTNLTTQATRTKPKRAVLKRKHRLKLVVAAVVAEAVLLPVQHRVQVRLSAVFQATAGPQVVADHARMLAVRQFHC